MLKKANLLLLFLCLSFGVFAKTADLKVEKSEIEKEFASVSSLEQYLLAHPNADLETIKTENPELLAGVELEASTKVSMAPQEKMPLVSGFWWGCVLGIIGLALVYFITENDKSEVKSALWGCLVATLLWGLGGIFWGNIF
jgi:hypothetical protein